MNESRLGTTRNRIRVGVVLHFAVVDSSVDVSLGLDRLAGKSKVPKRHSVRRSYVEVLGMGQSRPIPRRLRFFIGFY